MQKYEKYFLTHIDTLLPIFNNIDIGTGQLSNGYISFPLPSSISHEVLQNYNDVLKQMKMNMDGTKKKKIGFIPSHAGSPQKIHINNNALDTIVNIINEVNKQVDDKKIKHSKIDTTVLTRIHSIKDEYNRLATPGQAPPPINLSETSPIIEQALPPQALLHSTQYPEQQYMEPAGAQNQSIILTDTSDAQFVAQPAPQASISIPKVQRRERTSPSTSASTSFAAVSLATLAPAPAPAPFTQQTVAPPMQPAVPFTQPTVAPFTPVAPQMQHAFNSSETSDAQLPPRPAPQASISIPKVQRRERPPPSTSASASFAAVPFTPPGAASASFAAVPFTPPGAAAPVAGTPGAPVAFTSITLNKTQRPSRAPSQAP